MTDRYEEPNDAETDPSDAVELLTAENAAELHRRLLLGPRCAELDPAHGETLLRRYHGEGQPDALETAVLLCTDWGYYRGTAGLIARIAGSGLLTEAELDELADHLLQPVVVVEVPADWFGPAFVIPLGGALGSGSDVPVAAQGAAIMERRIRPPLRRWAADRRMRQLEGSLEELEELCAELDAADAAAVVQGMCDAVEVLDDETAEAVLAKAVRWPRAQVRKIALDQLVARGEEQRARGLARQDPDAKIRRWATGRRSRSGAVDLDSAAGSSGRHQNLFDE